MVEGSLVPAVLIWEASSGELLNSLIQLEAVRCLAFSPDGRQLAVLTTSGSLQTWSVSR
jgi:WD40 repeat protein